MAGVEEALGRGRYGDFRVPDLATLIEYLEYDTIYHEHFSYFSLFSIRQIFGSKGLVVVDVEEIPTHGGSLRVYFAHAEEGREVSPAVEALVERERRSGPPRRPERTALFTEGVEMSKRALLDVLIDARDAGRQVVGYGAPGKGNTLLNYCGIRTDLLRVHGRPEPLQAGQVHTRHPDPDPRAGGIAETRPDLILILPWNLAPEISAQLAYTAEWGAELVVPIPAGPDVRPGAVPGKGPSAVKVVIFCGGLGVRMGEATQRIPKPMIRIGNRPILWEIMRYYAAWGHNEFVLCLGYKGDVIREYFLNYNEALFNDFVLEGHGADARVELLKRDVGGWRITFVDTGMQTTIGERLKAVEAYLADDDEFLATYGDGLTDAPLDEMVDAFRTSGRLVQFLSVRPEVNPAPRDHRRATGSSRRWSR